MNLIENPETDYRESVVRISNIEERTSKNDNEYVLVEDTSGSKYYVWSDGWRNHLTENKDFYMSELMRVNFEEVDPPFYCVLRSITPISWDDSKPEEKDFKRCFTMTEDDNKLKTSDVPREERIVNQAANKFGLEAAKLKASEGYAPEYNGDEDEFDEWLQKEINKWASKFRIGALTGSIE